MKLQRTEETLASAAAKVGMDQKTARKYRRLGRPPSQAKKPRATNTREGVFQDVWLEVEQLLQQDQRVEAVTIMDHLCRKYAGRFKPSQLRTLQRRIKQWRASAGAPREVFFPQQHQAWHWATEHRLPARDPFAYTKAWSICALSLSAEFVSALVISGSL
jgi:hypothetical protein